MSSLMIPPKKKLVTSVSRSGARRKYQTRLAGPLGIPSGDSDCRSKDEDVLWDVDDEVEEESGEAHLSLRQLGWESE